MVGSVRFCDKNDNNRTMDTAMDSKLVKVSKVVLITLLLTQNKQMCPESHNGHDY